jgi:hypothetical protein
MSITSLPSLASATIFEIGLQLQETAQPVAKDRVIVGERDSDRAVSATLSSSGSVTSAAGCGFWHVLHV